MAMPKNCQENKIMRNDICDQIFKHLGETRDIARSPVDRCFLEAAKNVVSIRYVHREIDHENSKKEWNHGTLEKDDDGKPHKNDACNNLMKDKTMQAKTPKDIDLNPKGGILPLENEKKKHVKKKRKKKGGQKNFIGKIAMSKDSLKNEKWNDGTLEEDNGGKPCKSDSSNNLIKDETSQATTPRDIDVNPKGGPQFWQCKNEINQKQYSWICKRNGVEVHNASISMGGTIGDESQNCWNGNKFERKLGHKVAHKDQEVSHQSIVGKNSKPNNGQEERQLHHHWLGNPLHMIILLLLLGKNLQHLCILDLEQQAIMTNPSILKILSQHWKCDQMPKLTSFTPQSSIIDIMISEVLKHMDANTTTNSLITKGQNVLEPQNKFLKTPNELGMQFQHLISLPPTLGEDFLSQIPCSMSNELSLQEVPSRYLEDAMMVVQNLISLETSNSFQINQLQCQHLSGKLCKSMEDVDAYIQDLTCQVGSQSTKHIFKNLLQAAKDAEILVKGCCNNHLIQAAITMANAKEHFASLAYKVELCMALLRNNSNEETKQKFLNKLQDWTIEVSIKELQIIDEKANIDRQELLSTLKAQAGSNIQLGNLIKRLGTIGHHDFGVRSATSVMDMWKEEYTNLQRLQTLVKKDGASLYKILWHGGHFAEKCFHGGNHKSFQKEASILAGLDHPNIAPSFCYATSDRSCSIVMELLDEDLHDLIQRKPLDAPFELIETIDIMLQIAEGMRYLHQNKVIHRDLKSMNILVKCGEHVSVKVADFGLSKIKESSCTDSYQTTDQGTTRWMAPELFGDSEDQNGGEFQKSLQYHFKVDIYSFGMLCYEIMTGRIPFHEIDSMTLLRKRIKDGLRPILPNRCPEQLSTLIQRCYHSNPATRPSFIDICGDLRHIMCSLMLESTFYNP